MDLINMMDREDEGYKYILTYIDHFSKFVVLSPLKTKTSAEVVKTVRTQVLAKFNLPRILHTDNGGEFCDTGLKSMIDSWPGNSNCRIVHGRPRYPQSQGVVERANRSVKERIATREVQWRMDGHTGNIPWTDWLPDIASQMNCTLHKTIGMTPFELVFGRLPYSNQIGEELSEDETPSPSRELSPEPAVLDPAPEPLFEDETPPSSPLSSLHLALSPSPLREPYSPEPLVSEPLVSSQELSHEPFASGSAVLDTAFEPLAFEVPVVESPSPPRSSYLSSSSAVLDPESVLKRAQKSTAKFRNYMIKQSMKKTVKFSLHERVTVVMAKKKGDKGTKSAKSVNRIPAIIVKVLRNGLYRLACPVGILKNGYGSNSLLACHLDRTGWPRNRISLTTATRRYIAQLYHPQPRRMSIEEIEEMEETCFEHRQIPLFKTSTDGLVEKDFSEDSCERFLEVTSLISNMDTLVEAAKVVKSTLPRMPETRPQQFNATPLGRFGDGYIRYIPKELRDNDLTILKTDGTDNCCLYRAVSLLIWGHEDKCHFLRMAATITGILRQQEIVEEISANKTEEQIDMYIHSATTDVVLASLEGGSQERLKQALEQELRLSLKPNRDAGLIQCMTLAMYLQMPIKVWTVYGGSSTSTTHGQDQCEDSSFLELVMVPYDLSTGSRLTHYVPVVESRLVGADREVKSCCGADIFGLCQGYSEKMVQCSVCYQWYHMHCVVRYRNVEEEEFLCGCHKLMPLESKDLQFYTDKRKVVRILQMIKLQNLTREIYLVKYPSARLTAFMSSSLKEKQFWKSRMAFDKFGQDVVRMLFRKLSEIHPGNRMVLFDVYCPEAAVHLVMKQEDMNRMEAELFLASLMPEEPTDFFFMR